LKKVRKIEPNSKIIKPKLQVAAYARVSTDNDEQLVSLEAQKTHYESFIKSNPDWEFAGIYYDEGVTGTNKENRSELQRLIEDCENRRIDFIVTKSISRFARNTIDCLELIRKLSDIGVFLYFEKENINTQSMDGELMLTILSSLAENESISISQNNKWSIQRRFRNGTFKLSSPPYGYDYEDGILIVNEEQAAVVRRIFSEALSGKGAQKIADDLNADGTPPKKAALWNASTILGMLSNEKYTGDVILQKTYTDDHFKRHRNNGEKDQIMIRRNHEAIISHEEFDAVNELLRQRGDEKGIEKGKGKYQKRYPFSGKIICSECGSHFKRRIHYYGGSQYIAWCCSKHIHDIAKCSMRFIREDDIHQAFITMINKLIFGYEFILKPLLKSLRSLNYSANLTEILELEQKLEENMERSRVLTNLLTKGYLSSSLFNEQINELRAEATLLKEKKKVLSRSVNSGMTAVSEVEQLLKWASNADMIESFDEAIFSRYVESIIVYSQEEIGFKLKCGLTLKERLVR
jgi:site-specific DNA recombinase